MSVECFLSPVTCKQSEVVAQTVVLRYSHSFEDTFVDSRCHFHSSLYCFLLADTFPSLPASHAVSRWIDHNWCWEAQLFSHFAAVIDLFLCSAKSSQNGLTIRLSPKVCGRVIQTDDGCTVLVPPEFLYLIFSLSPESRESKIISDSSLMAFGYAIVSIMI